MNPVSSADPGSVGGQFAIAVQKKMNDVQAEQGQSEVALIESSSPQKATSGSVGTRLHVVA